MIKDTEILATNDVMFKIILGDPRHSRLLIHFLNAAIKSETPITSVEITNTELTPEYVWQKGSRLDVRAKTQNGELINVEMQCGADRHMAARALFYWSRMFAGQIEVSDQYYKLKRTISINILDFRLFDDERYWRKGHITDDETKRNITELLEMQFIELNKLRQVEKESPITFWVEFFRDPYSKSVKALCDYVPEIKEAKQIYEKAKSDPKARALIETREKALRDYTNDIACAKDEGKAEGKIEMVLELLRAGVDVDIIAQTSGLSIEEIESLRNKQ
ncbi:MAG: Rpn family recombination-promoting nuclease/putative transposase [Holosporaceae bacterium]|jgi:predicted transposase/invertase (TIGR01784 family)|nr:Rpn family recombination-promoting nuclease/putative transposase [Holosporaceae bacterium]